MFGFLNFFHSVAEMRATSEKATIAPRETAMQTA